jgi:hypothetical protein
MNCNRQIGMEIADKVNRFLPEQATGLGESVQNLGQDFFSCDQVASCEGAAGGDGGLVPLVFAVGDGDPVERIDENPPHADGRFGVP